MDFRFDDSKGRKLLIERMYYIYSHPMLNSDQKDNTRIIIFIYFSYQLIVLLIFRVERKQEKEGRDVTEYQIFVSDRELVVVNGSCVELVATGVVFPHEKITCEFSLHFSCWFQFYHTFLAYSIFYCQQIFSIFPCFF